MLLPQIISQFDQAFNYNKRIISFVYGDVKSC